MTVWKFRVMTALLSVPANLLVALVSSNTWCFIFNKIYVFMCAILDWNRIPFTINSLLGPVYDAAEINLITLGCISLVLNSFLMQFSIYYSAHI